MALSHGVLFHCHFDSAGMRRSAAVSGRRIRWTVPSRGVKRGDSEMQEEELLVVKRIERASSTDDISSSRLYESAIDSLPPESFAVLMSCAIGILTGVGVVAFNYAVHEIHDVLWQGVPRITWFRSQPLSKTWVQVLAVPVGGGTAVGIINSIQAAFFATDAARAKSSSLWNKVRAVVRQVLKTTAAAITLGTANSLGPEGPSVEIGSSIAEGVGTVFKNSRERRASLVAAGSAAGISSGFNAAVAGCFFAVESILRSAPASSLSTAMVLLSSVLASVVSQAGLGKDPAFKVAAYDFRSPAELPLYLLLGVLCGGVSICLTKGSAYATSGFNKLQKSTGIPTAFLPPIGGLCVGAIALAYPEVLYWGFENVDAILESRPWAKGPPADLLIQIVAAKIVATSICRGSRLVGGVYAPSLFIGAALGSAYGKYASYAITHADPLYHLDTLQVAAPQAYALVGMAATLAGVCQVPFTSVLLLFELTRDYRIILPLMAAVGLSSWIASSYSEKKDASTRKSAEQSSAENGQAGKNGAANIDENRLSRELTVSEAMRTTYLSIYPDAQVEEAVNLMIRDKEWCIFVVGKSGNLEGVFTLGDIQNEAEKGALSGMKVSSICKQNVVTAKPEMRLSRAQQLMSARGLRQLPVVSRDGLVVGVIDQAAIQLACRVEATRRMLQPSR